jgi:hypothetical protein
LLNGVGKYSKEMDTVLLGKYIRTLYNGFKQKEVSVLVQLRTGIVRLNGYLYRIRVVESD